MTTSKPKLSVAMVTFNHAEYIAKALDSVLMQQVNFDYEIVIGDDFSTDATRDILRDYQRRHPAKLKPIFRDRNIGTMKNVKEVFETCQGEYMALLAGDDYWTDPRKLQLQVDYLDKHRDCSFCHHTVDYVEWPGGRKVKEYPPAKFRVERPDPGELAKINFVQVIAIVLRKQWMPVLDERFVELKIEDWPLVVLLSQRGWIGYLDRNMAHYRIHTSNAWANRPPDYKIRAMESMAWYIHDHVEGRMKDLWKDTILALALKDIFVAVKSMAPLKALGKLKYFFTQSLRFGKPFWLLNGLWPYVKAAYLAK